MIHLETISTFSHHGSEDYDENKSQLHKTAMTTYKHEKDLYFTLFQTSPGFYVSAVLIFLKTLWKKEKLLVTSNFSFSRSVFYLFRNFSAIIVKRKIVVCKVFQFGRV